jgi:glyoxylase-like metal-dependent hydrolase (beta-lactamase superfamily II)
VTARGPANDAPQGLRRLSASLYMLEDTCNAYAVADDGHALVIDPGSGRILDALKAVGVAQVEWVLHTHHHRDQCWGDRKLLDAGAQLAVPEHERFLFDQTELFWQTRRLHGSYVDRSTSFTLGRSLPVAATLDDYEIFSWRGLELFVLPAKGHTYGSSALIADIDGTRVAFTGDLISHGGKLHQAHSLDYFHGDKLGVAFTLQSLRALRKQRPASILPSHGPTIEDPAGDLDRLEERLLRMVALGYVRLDEGADTLAYLPEMPMFEISRHLLWSGPYTCSNFYVIKSESGKALFIDYGHSLWAYLHLSDFEPLERLRFVEHHLDELRERHGITSFDVVIPTHAHDDHVCGIPYLQRHHDTQCWALREVGQVLAEPAAWSSTPGTMEKPSRIDRWLDDGERFRWEEYELSIHHLPGQTEFHALVAVKIDGRTVAFTGDSFVEKEVPIHPTRREPRALIGATPFRDSFQFSMHQRCAEVLGEVMPDLVCTGHGEPIPCDRSKVRSYAESVDRYVATLRTLASEPAEQSVDMWWARLVPYRHRAQPGDTIDYTLLLRNNFGRRIDVGARMVDDGSILAPLASCTLAADARGQLALAYVVPDGLGHGRHVVTVELLIDGRSLGPVVEAVVEIER